MNEPVLNMSFESGSVFVPAPACNRQAGVPPNMDLNYYCGVSDACDMLFDILAHYTVPVEDIDGEQIPVVQMFPGKESVKISFPKK